MNVKEAYDNWAEQYDSNENKTRDLEGKALREVLSAISFDSCLEMGCGTGKNTEWLATRCSHLTCVDLSEEMLKKAKEKVTAGHVRFLQANMINNTVFSDRLYDLVTFSLVLEHVEDLDPVIKKAASVLKPGGFIYIGELHPFKQYSGSKARFETKDGVQIVTCFNHHISEFTECAKKHGMEIADLREYFDNDDRSGIPRILSLLLRKI
jgi:ubiquinone/menaquinone biosynthesis C-methylase UbiE